MSRHPNVMARETSVSTRAGMTLVELMVALTIFGVVITSAVAFAARQNSAFQESIVRMGALRNLRYAMTTLEQDLQTLGTNVPSSQPHLVYGDSNVVVFSADYVTNVANDVFAVFYDPSAPAGQVGAPTSAFVVPTTAVTVADSVYTSQGVRSPAELIAFYFDADTTTARTDDFVLYRKVNDASPELLARNLLRVATEPFFRFHRETTDSVGVVSLDTVASADLPLWHASPMHLAVADTGRVAWPDSVRAVGVTIGATNGMNGEQERRVDGRRLVALPNAGLEVLSTCGSAPLLGVPIVATPGSTVSGDPMIALTWTSAMDEVGGEGDVVRYVVWKRTFGTSDWGDPYVAIPAGLTTYTYEDAAVESGGVYEFALAAQDCTPTLSTRAVSAPVVLP